jgi:hypothetical protein
LLDPISQDHVSTFRTVEAAWKHAGRSERPRHVTSFWYALSDNPEAQLNDYARRYLAIFGDEFGAAMADACTASSAAIVTDAIKRLEDAGCDELILVPTSADLGELERLIALIT